MPDNRSEIDPEQCKGCGVCVENCPRKCLVLGEELNGSGYRYAKFVHQRCVACGICFYVCPEPGAITVHQAPRPDAGGQQPAPGDGEQDAAEEDRA